MSPSTHPAEGPSLEECIDELDVCIGNADRFPPGVMAFALRTHLGGLLHVLLRERTWSTEQVRQFIDELRQEALHGE